MRKGTDQMFVTGLSSAQARRQADKARRLAEEKEAKQKVMAPGADIVFQWIEQEKKDVVNLEKIILNVSDEKLLQAQLLARQMHLKFLDSCKTRAENLMRVPKKREKQAESFDV